MQHFLFLVCLTLLPVVAGYGQTAPILITGKVTNPRQATFAIGDSTLPLSPCG
jgi:hypothetical protein